MQKCKQTYISTSFSCKNVNKHIYSLFFMQKCKQTKPLFHAKMYIYSLFFMQKCK